jgi:hypothetical protein
MRLEEILEKLRKNLPIVNMSMNKIKPSLSYDSYGTDKWEDIFIIDYWNKGKNEELRVSRKFYNGDEYSSYEYNVWRNDKKIFHFRRGKDEALMGKAVCSAMLLLCGIEPHVIDPSGWSLRFGNEDIKIRKNMIDITSIIVGVLMRSMQREAWDRESQLIEQKDAEIKSLKVKIETITKGAKELIVNLEKTCINKET